MEIYLVLFWEVDNFKHAIEKSAVISSYKELTRHSNQHDSLRLSLFHWHKENQAHQITAATIL